MRVLRGLAPKVPVSDASVATVGNFDGVHRGHLKLLSKLMQHSKRSGLESVVVTFEPLPREYFGRERAPSRLTRLRERLELLGDAGIDKVWLMPFSAQLAMYSAAEFVQRILVDGLHLTYLLVGDDFRFGAERKGDYRLLQESGAQHGFEVEAMDTHMLGDQRISSTAIRNALFEGRFADARELLGRPFTMQGRVVHGGKLGRKLGFPTANIRPGRRITPLHGIYAVWVSGVAGEKRVASVASIGTRPTVTGSDEVLLEVHLFDFEGDLYGSRLEVEFVKKLRDEEKFSTIDALVDQMHLDAAQAREILEKQ